MDHLVERRDSFMTHRLLCALFVAALTVPAAVVAKPPDLPENGSAIYQLHPTARGTLAGSMLMAVHPALAWLPTDKALDIPSDHPQNTEKIQTFEPDHLLSGLTPASTITNDLNIPIKLAVEGLPMPQEDSNTATDGITCPYLRQQMQDRHACQLADPQMGREVLDNLERLENADKLLQLAKDLASEGDLEAAVECCLRAEALCPGSPCAEHAIETMLELTCGSGSPTTTEEAAELRDEEPGVEQQVCGLMKACHLLASQGMYHQAAELARQAYALDPQRVQADPLLYQMHLLAESSPSTASEPSEPPTCPYCPSAGKPIREIVPEEKKNDTGPETLLVPPLPPVDYEVVPALDGMLTESAKEDQPSAGAEEASEAESAASMQDLIEMLLGDTQVDVGTHADGGLRLCGECAVGDNVYHLRYSHGSLAIWTTPDASKSKASNEDRRQIEYEWERIWFRDMPSRLTPERVHGGLIP
jgi:tetratricopeptide (TPR) repeat protein